MEPAHEVGVVHAVAAWVRRDRVEVGVVVVWLRC